MIFFVCFQSPPKGESSNEENKEVSAAPASESLSQEATPEKGKNNRTDLHVNIQLMMMYIGIP